MQWNDEEYPWGTPEAPVSQPPPPYTGNIGDDSRHEADNPFPPAASANGDPNTPPDGDPNWVWVGDRWAKTIPDSTPFGPSSGPTGSSGPYQFAPMQWPDWNPPTFNAPPAFSYADFKPPTLEEAQNEPGYKFAADEGAKRLQNNAAAKGNIISGGAIKDLSKWASDYATQNYNGVYGRGLQTYGTNRNNAADTYMMNYNVSRDVFDRSYNSYAAGDASRRQRAQLDFQRDWDIYSSDLDTRRFIATGGNN